MERPSVGVGVIVIRDNKILLLRRTNAHGEGTWAPPGGHLEFKETFEECARRETTEETAVAVEGLIPVALTNDLFVEELRHYITVWVEGETKSAEITVAHPEKVTHVGWFALDALPVPLFLPFQNLLKGDYISFNVASRWLRQLAKR